MSLVRQRCPNFSIHVDPRRLDHGTVSLLSDDELTNVPRFTYNSTNHQLETQRTSVCEKQKQQRPFLTTLNRIRSKTLLLIQSIETHKEAIKAIDRIQKISSTDTRIRTFLDLIDHQHQPSWQKRKLPRMSPQLPPRDCRRDQRRRKGRRVQE